MRDVPKYRSGTASFIHRHIYTHTANVKRQNIPLRLCF